MSMIRIRYASGLLVLAMLVATGLGRAEAQRYVPGDVRLSGTYELESTRGDNPQQVADEATRGLREAQRDRVYRRMLSRLEPPSTLSIERHGQTVTIASSTGPRTTFDADGRVRTEQAPNGRAMSTRAEIAGDRPRQLLAVEAARHA